MKAPSQLVISAKESDSYHLQRLVDIIGRGRVCQSPGYSWVQLLISSVQLVEGLQSQGITMRKTLTCMPWNGRMSLMKHYWRGVIDGDGSIWRRNGDGRWIASLVGTKAMTDAFGSWSKELSPQLYADSHPGHGRVWQIQFSGNGGVKRILQELYGDASIALDRKYQLAMEALSSP